MSENSGAHTLAQTDCPLGVLHVAYTPDSDDAFNYYAWEHGRVSLPDHQATFDREAISAFLGALRATFSETEPNA